jgi:glycosyltransferase involved in cell wall biosynthesis
MNPLLAATFVWVFSEIAVQIWNLMLDNSEEFAVVGRPYLLVTNIPVFVDDRGRTLFDRGWYHDLVQHLHYIPAFTLAAPLCPLPAETRNLVPVEAGLCVRMRLVPLPRQSSRMGSLAQAFWTFWILWGAVGKAEIVHSGIAGWPYPLGWMANLIAKLRGKKLLIIVESAPWRITEKTAATASFLKKFEASVYELLARYWCSRADLSFYTQPAYREQLHRNGKGPAFVAPATWVNVGDVLGEAQAESLWDEKAIEPVRFLFAGRLVAEKGVRILLHAVEKLSAAGLNGSLHIIGEGPLLNEVIAAERNTPFELKRFEPVPYGAPFLTFLQRYHAVVVPSLSDEQPRILFDAAARAVPLLGSETDGLRHYVEDNCTGHLIRPGDSGALAAAMASWVNNPAALRRLGMEALSRVRRRTHRTMHAERSQIIACHFNPSSTAQAESRQIGGLER